jgi:hypothetical protein
VTEQAEKRRHYTPEERENAVRTYLALGSYVKAGEALGMCWQAIALWKHRDPVWWEETVAKVQMELEEQYRAGWRNVLSNALSVMQDRLENGNHKLVKVETGEDGQHKPVIVRVPVEAKDAVVIGGIACDKLRVSMGLPSRITGKVEDNDRLNDLRKLAQASREARKSAPVEHPAEVKPH